MTTAFGVTPQGFNRKTVENIIDELEADERADIGDNVDVSTESLIGQLNGIFGRHLGIAWEQLEVCYHGFDPDAAEGRLLDMLGKLTGTFRRGNTASEVLLLCDLDIGTTLTPDEAYAHTEDRPDIRWTPIDEFTAPSTGSHSVAFRSELEAAIPGLAGTVNAISTAVAGWNSVLNPDDAELGGVIDTDPLFRTRRERELATIGSATVRAITANVAQQFIDEVQNLAVFENDTGSTDENGLPPHSVEVVIFDGDVPSVDDDDLAQVIFDSKAAGIRAYGNTSGTALALINGVEVPKEVGFTRATQLPIYLIIDVQKKAAGYPGDDAVKAYVAAAANAYFGPRAAIVESVISKMALDAGGVEDSISVKLGLLPAPTLSANIPIGFREIGRFSTSRITINASI